MSILAREGRKEESTNNNTGELEGLKGFRFQEINKTPYYKASTAKTAIKSRISVVPAADNLILTSEVKCGVPTCLNVNLNGRE